MWTVTENIEKIALTCVAQLGIVPHSKRLLVQPRAHAWVADSVPQWGMYERQLINISLDHNYKVFLRKFRQHTCACAEERPCEDTAKRQPSASQGERAHLPIP